MKQLEERILRDGKVRPGGILKVDNFLNHQMDPLLLYEMGLEIRRLFSGERINKVLTVEASGIAIAVMAGYALGCPVVFAKKSKSRNISDDVWSTDVVSFTHGNTNTILVSKEYLGPEDNVLIVDDFLATGAALMGMSQLCSLAGASVAGCCCAIEKVQQGGGDRMRAKGIHVEALARIASMGENGVLTFC